MLLNKNNAFIAVITAVIISAIVLIIAIAISSSNFISRFNSLSFEMKDISKGVAKGCLEYARLKLAVGFYGGNETTTISSYNCYIYPIETVGTTTIIKSNATVQNKTTNLKLTVSNGALQTIYLEEVSGF
ncbi:MAG: hypothetical protein QMD65_01385 [Patescibacteria group bacterium]|nr:hypothetical protein [Patescibacteria group bacterium]